VLVGVDDEARRSAPTGTPCVLDAFLSLHVRVEVALHAAPTAAWCWPRCTRHTLRAVRSLEMDFEEEFGGLVCMASP